MSTSTLQLSEHELPFVFADTPVTAEAMRIKVEVKDQERWFLARLEWLDVNIEGRELFAFFYRDETSDANDIFGGRNYVSGGRDRFTRQELLAVS